jgi:hypothetical protein
MLSWELVPRALLTARRACPVLFCIGVLAAGAAVLELSAAEPPDVLEAGPAARPGETQSASAHTAASQYALLMHFLLRAADHRQHRFRGRRPRCADRNHLGETVPLR